MIDVGTDLQNGTRFEHRLKKKAKENQQSLSINRVVIDVGTDLQNGTRFEHRLKKKAKENQQSLSINRVVIDVGTEGSIVI